MKKTILVILILIAAGAAFAQNRIQLKIASVAPSRSPWDIEQRALAQEWSQITGGLVTVTFFDVQSLGGEKSVIQRFRSVRPGQRAPLDGAIFTTIGLHELAPKASIYTLTMPFLIRSQQELDAVLDKMGDHFVNEYKAAGFEMIAWTNVGWLSFYTKDPFASLNDLKRIKIASAGLESPVLGDSFRAAGFTIEDLPASRLLQSLRSNSGVRGFFGVHLYAYVTGFSKNISYGLDTKLSPIMAGFVLSNDAWDRIPEHYKPAMMEAVERMRQRLNESLEASDRQYVANMKNEGVNMITPSPDELAVWEADFAKDIELVNRAAPGAFDMKLYARIRELITQVRNRQ